MTCKNRPRYDLQCVWWDVKPSSINYISVRHYVLTTFGDIVVCFHTAVCLELLNY